MAWKREGEFLLHLMQELRQHHYKLSEAAQFTEEAELRLADFIIERLPVGCGETIEGFGIIYEDLATARISYAQRIQEIEHECLAIDSLLQTITKRTT